MPNPGSRRSIGIETLSSGIVRGTKNVRDSMWHSPPSSHSSQRSRFAPILEIDGDSLLFPVAVAGRVEPLLFARGRARLAKRLRVGHRRRGTEIGRRVEVLRAFHDAKMVSGTIEAKR